MSVEQNCRTWPHAWFGFFSLGRRTEPPGPPRYVCLPEVTDFVDWNWRYPHVKELTAYLRSHEDVIALELRQTPCLLCAQKHSPSRFHWDGVWLWPASLSHYVETHGIRLPDRMVEHIERRGFLPLGSLPAIPFEMLPWPAVRPGFRFSTWLKSLVTRGDPKNP